MRTTTILTTQGTLTIGHHGERRAPVVVVVDDERQPMFTRPLDATRGHGNPEHAAYAAAVTRARLHLVAALTDVAGAQVDGREVPQGTLDSTFTVSGLLSTWLAARGLPVGTQGWDAVLAVPAGTPVPPKGWEDPSTALRGIRKDSRPKAHRGSPLPLVSTLLAVTAATPAETPETPAETPETPAETPETPDTLPAGVADVEAFLTAVEGATQPEHTSPEDVAAVKAAERAARRERRTGAR